MELNKKEVELVKKAIIEYEENHYESESNLWQVKINKLIWRLNKNE